MNDREDWPSRNPYMQQFSFPLPDVMPNYGLSSNWVHVPPQIMPWGLPASSHPAVVRFTAGEFSHHPVKRKTDLDVDILPPSKQLVTEEKMAAHMSNLHISEVEPPEMVVTEDNMETNKIPKLVVCDEVRKLKTEPIIPQSLLSKLERPKMALVLWKPPAGDLGAKLKEVTKRASRRDEDDIEKEVDMEAEGNNVDNTFRPIDPVPMHGVDNNQYLQPTPQFHGNFPFS